MHHLFLISISRESKVEYQQIGYALQLGVPSTVYLSSFNHLSDLLNLLASQANV